MSGRAAGTRITVNRGLPGLILGELVTPEYDVLPVKRDQLHRARELVMAGVFAARSA
jgi:hypothetical protein